MENLNLLRLFLSHLPEPPRADEALIEIVRTLVFSFVPLHVVTMAS